ncbi:MAG: hypothetical protein ACLRJV_08815 [Eubacteriales bacterium]
MTARKCLNCSKLSAIQTKQQFEEQGEASPETPATVNEDEQDMEL